MKVIGWSPHLTPERAEEAGVAYASREEIFRNSDIVSVHMVLSPSTHHLITSEDLGRMKSTAFLINTARGPIIEENALIQVLSEEKIAGAGLDVFDVEPLPLDHPIRRLKNAVLSPHTGYVSDANYEVS
jgi:phosphoglycerate dehydrogenase-like enzyme